VDDGVEIGVHADLEASLPVPLAERAGYVEGVERQDRPRVRAVPVDLVARIGHREDALRIGG